VSDDTPVMNPVLAAADPAQHLMNLHGVPSQLAILWRQASIDSLERFQERPNRIQAEVRLTSVASFCEFVNRFGNAATSIYLDVYGSERPDHGRDRGNLPVPPRFVGVIDHPDKDKPAWGGFSAVYEPRLSMEWKAWRDLHGAGAVDQVRLVEFLEDHANDILEPTPASVLTAASQFEAVETHRYTSHRNLDNGNVQITYNKGTDTATVTFPHRLTLSIPVVEGGDPRRIDCRLRYRTAEGAIRFLVQLAEDPDRVERDTYRVEAEAVRKLCAGLKLYEGVADTRHRRID
jgi:uncharacterized protein YfdQ (DUF2303 family)